MKRLLLSGLVIGWAAQFAVAGGIDELPQKDPSEMNRVEWQAHVKAARERVAIARREHRSYEPQPPSFEEIAAEASRRVLEDDSLRPGDIVSTDHGLFRFRELPGRERNVENFVPVR